MKEDYNLQKQFTPSFIILQKNIGKEIHKFFGNKKITIIDLGFGTGLTSEEILIQNPKAKILGVDVDPTLMTQAQDLLNKFKNRLTVAESDALIYLKKIQSDSIDVVASAFTIHNFKPPYRHKILKEIFRVLKKDGLFVNSDKYNSSDPKKNKDWFDYHYNYQLQKLTSLGKEDIAKGWYKHHLQDNKKNTAQLDEPTIKEMEQIGFEHIKITYRNHLVATLTSLKL